MPTRNTPERTYNNPWIPEDAKRALAAEDGRILDVGGGIAPYFRADTIIDRLPYDAKRLTANAWGGGNPDRASRMWRRDHYIQLDLTEPEPWPIEDKAFDLGLCFHCLEDLSDPAPTVKEIRRCCRRTAIVCPSRHFEQMRGIDHPRYCGMRHHQWLVSVEDGELVMRQKTYSVESKGAHFVCPAGRRLRVENGAILYTSERPQLRIAAGMDSENDLAELVSFVQEHPLSADAFGRHPQASTWRYWWWRMRQQLLGEM